MAVVNSATLAAIETSFSLAFAAGQTIVKPTYKEIASELPGVGAKTVYPMLLELGGMREWIDEKEFEDLARGGYELVNKDWEKSFELDRNSIEDDTYGTLAPAAQRLGVAVADNPNVQVTLALEAGDATDCWDGGEFFDTAHPVNPFKPELGTWSNLETTEALDATNFRTQYTNFLAHPDSAGRPLNRPPDTLFVDASNYLEALELMNSEFISSSTNALRGLCRVVLLPRAADAGVWYLAATKAGGLVVHNPLIVQVRKAPVFVSRTAPDSDRVFTAKKFQYSAESRMGFGYGMPSQIRRMVP